MKKTISTFFILIFIFHFSFAQTPIPNLFSKSTSNAIASAELKRSVNGITSGQILTVNSAMTNQIYLQKDNYELVIPTQSGDLVVDLIPANITSADFKVMTPRGEYKMDLPTFYHGKIKGEKKSFVALTVTNNSIEGLIQSEKINLTLGKLKNQKEDFHIVYNTDEIQNSTPICAGEVVRSANLVSGSSTNSQTSAATCRAVEIYLEADYKMYQDWGNSVNNVVNTMTSIFNNVSQLYDNEGVNLVISTLFVWNTPDPYQSATGTSSMLGLLDTYWNGKANNFDGDIVHLVSTRNLGGGIAYYYTGEGFTSVFNGMPIRAVFAKEGVKDISKGLSASISSSVQNIPTYSWNVSVIAHEIGHNFGLPHTHNCTWSDGINPAGPIDNCGPTAGYSEGCTNGANPGTAGGTIMSYCHLVGGVGIKFSNGFGTLPGAKMLAEWNAATYLSGSKIARPIAIQSVLCGSASVTITASGCSGTYNWYNVAVGGSSLGSNPSFVTPVLNASTDYYVSCTFDGCTSKRTVAPVRVFTNTPPVVSNAAICGTSSSTTLSATGCLGMSFAWYSVASGGVALGNASSLAVSGIVSNTTYYVECGLAGCDTTSRVPVTITYTPLCPVCEPAGMVCRFGDRLTQIKILRNSTELLNRGNTCSTTGFQYIVPVNAIHFIRDSTYSLVMVSPSSEQDGLAVWIDYNRNNEFEPSEKIYSFYNGNPWTQQTANFAIPANASLGNLRMRIKVTWLESSNSPCSVSDGEGYGEIYDILVNVKCKENVVYAAATQAAGIYKVSETIQSQANVATGTTYQAGKNILLGPGFQAGSNEVFTAQIGGCQ